MGLTVNQVLRLNKFESFHSHKAFFLNTQLGQKNSNRLMGVALIGWCEYITYYSNVEYIEMGLTSKSTSPLLGLKTLDLWRIDLKVRIPPFHGGKSGALPLCATGQPKEVVHIVNCRLLVNLNHQILRSRAEVAYGSHNPCGRAVRIPPPQLT